MNGFQASIIRVALIPALAICLWVLGTGTAVAAGGLVPEIIIAWDGSGDFGPQTPGTTTCGWQEALTYCLALKSDNHNGLHHRDIYVKGGGVYDIGDTLYIRSMQDFRIWGGDYTLNWVGPSNKDMFVIDSVMDLRLSLSHLVYNGDGVALRFKPVNAVPWDGFPAWVDSQVKVTSIIRTLPTAGGAGVLFDTSSCGIVHADFFFGSIKNFATCLSAQGNFMLDRLRCPDLSSSNNNSTLAVLAGAKNIVELGIGAEGGATGVTGLIVTGSKNVVDITTKGGFAPGRDVFLGSGAGGNSINLSAAPDVADPFGLVTDNSSSSNQVTWAGGQSPVKTVSATSGTYTYAQRLCPASVMVVGGTISSVSQLRGGTTIDWGAYRGNIILGVGDRLRVTSASAPTIRVTPIKTQ